MTRALAVALALAACSSKREPPASSSAAPPDPASRAPATAAKAEPAAPKTQPDPMADPGADPSEDPKAQPQPAPTAEPAPAVEAPKMSDADHRLFQCATSSGDGKLVDKFLAKQKLVAGSEVYKAFVHAHGDWVRANILALQDLGDARKARACAEAALK